MSARTVRNLSEAGLRRRRFALNRRIGHLEIELADLGAMKKELEEAQEELAALEVEALRRAGTAA